ncbi:MAG: redoxin domain-containing protein [bacterium]|nr:redoxin domain-containing protein [bacterium]
MNVPDLTLNAYQDGKFMPIKLTDYKGKWLVLFFYPANFTFVCPTELEEMADHYEEIKALGAEVLSVSTDTEFSHMAWHDSSPAIGKVNFPMVADPTGMLCQELGTYIYDEGLSLRGTFIFDPEGTLKSFEMNDNSIGRSATELIRKLKAAIFVKEHPGQVCPASWTPGAKTLTPGPDLVGKI